MASALPRLLNLKNAFYLLVSLLVLYAIYKFFGAGAAFRSADFPLLSLAVLIFLAEAFFWNWAWALVGGVSFRSAQLSSFASMSGNLTPFGIGSDLMRSFFAKSEKKTFSQILASSFATKVYKILLAAAVLVLSFPLFSGLNQELQASLSLGTLFISAGAVSFLFFARFNPKFAESLLSSFETGRKINLFAKELRRFFAIPSPQVLFLLLVSLACEFAAFFLSFQALGITLSVSTALAVFFIVFFATKLPFHALGVSELVGIFLLQSQYSAAPIAAALISWDLVRAWAPALASTAFVFLNQR